MCDPQLISQLANILSCRSHLKRVFVAERKVVETERVELERRPRRDLSPRQHERVLQGRRGVVAQALERHLRHVRGRRGQ